MVSKISLTVPNGGGTAGYWPLKWRCEMAPHHFNVNPITWAKQAGAPQAVIDLLQKSNVDATGALISDTGTAAVAQWLPSFVNESSFVRMNNDGAFLQTGLYTRVGFDSASATSYVCGEGKAKPLTQLALASGTLRPRKVASLICMTEQSLIDFTAAGQNFAGRLMRQALGVETDNEFLSELIGTDTPTITASVDRPRESLFAALEAVDPGQGSRIYWIAGRSAARQMACAETVGGQAMFPGLGVLGGPLLGGTLLVSDCAAIGDDSLLLIDAAQILAAVGSIDTRYSRSASIEMEDAPNNASVGVSAQSLVSMFQTNSVAALLEMSFGFQRLRDCTALIDGIDWAVPGRERVTWPKNLLT
jgi:hypothetical protein